MVAISALGGGEPIGAGVRTKSEAQVAAGRRLSSLFPELGPWARAVLGSPTASFVDLPRAPLVVELPELRAQRVVSLLPPLLAGSHPDIPADLLRAIRAEAFNDTVAGRNAVAAAADLTARFGSAGIASVVIKGPAVASRYRPGHHRSFGDVDVLVDPRAFTAAFVALQSDGWHEDPSSHQPWPAFHRWCREAETFSRGPAHVDLHHRPSPWLWTRRLSAQRILSRASTVRIGERSVPCAGAADNLLISALQLITDHRQPGAKLLAWRDIVELGAHDPIAIANRAEECRLAGVLRALLSGMPAELRPAELFDALGEHIEHPTRLLTMLDAAERGAYVRAHMARLPLPNAAIYVAGTLLPSPSFVRQRYPDRTGRRRLWWREVRQPSAGAGTAA